MKRVLWIFLAFLIICTMIASCSAGPGTTPSPLPEDSTGQQEVQPAPETTGTDVTPPPGKDKNIIDNPPTTDEFQTPEPKEPPADSGSPEELPSATPVRPTMLPDDAAGVMVEIVRQLTIIPNEVILPPGGQVIFRTCIDGNLEQAQFSLLETNAGSANPDGTYTAPSRTGTFHLTAVSASDPSLEAVAEIRVYQKQSESFDGPGIHMMQDGWTLETLTPQFPMGCAPFDVAVLPDGRVITIGVDDGDKVFASIDLSGNVEHTRIPSPVNRGGYFEASDDGRVWFWENMAGRLWVSAEGDEAATLVTEDLPKDGYGGSMSVQPDGSAVYINWGGPERTNVLYRYTPGTGVETVLDAEQARGLSCVEISSGGTVFVALDSGFYTLQPDGTPELWMKIEFEVGIQADSLTSDENGNLYFCGSGRDTEGSDYHGIYRVSPDKEISLYAEFPDIYMPMGMAWNPALNLLFGAQKINNNIAVYSPAGTFPLLDSSLYLNLPMALAFTPDGNLLINYEEAGLFRIDDYYRASPFCLDVVCFGPPTAGMVIASDNSIYYTAAAPDLSRDIMNIDESGNAVSVLQPDGMPAGIDIAPDGRIFFADWVGCAIYELHEDGTTSLYKDGIPYPLGLVIDEDYNFWVTAAATDAVVEGNPLVDCIDVPRPRILKIDTAGNITEILDISGFMQNDQVYLGYLDIAADGTVYVSDGNMLYSIKEGQDYQSVAVGLNQVSSVRFGPNGCLYMTDSSTGRLFRLHR